MSEIREYQCDACGGEFTSEWSEEDARAEAVKNFGEETVETQPMGVVCDNCYKLLCALYGIDT